MTHQRARPDLRTIAADLRLWALELVLWLAEMLGAHVLGPRLKAWAQSELAWGERHAMSLVVLTALRALPPEPPAQPRALRPLSAPRGFARVWREDARMARVARGLFPRERDVHVRARRLERTLADLDAAAASIVRRLMRRIPLTHMRAVAPPAARCVAACAAPKRAPDDTS